MKVEQALRIATEARLHDYAARLLDKWTAGIDRGRIALHTPAPRGRMRVLPDMPFHLWPELFLQISGVTEFEFPEERCRVGPGELCLVPQGLPHRERIVDHRGSFLNLVFMYRPDGALFHLARRSEEGAPKAFILSRVEGEGEQPKQLADQLEDGVRWFADGGDAKRRRLGWKGLLLSHLAALRSGLGRNALPASALPFRVAQARQVVLQNLSDPSLSVRWIARRLEANPDYLSRLFQKATGRPLVVYIHQQRMERARDLLEFSTLNISEISQTTGYADPSYFTRTFRRLTGLSPRAYRAQLRL